MVKMQVYKVGVDPQRRMPFMLLSDEETKRLLPIYIGAFEANAIAAQLYGRTYSRPLTHDLLKSVIETLGYEVTRISITKLEEGTFFALIHLEGFNQALELDARPSDAIALALRSQVPIFVAESVLEQAQFLNEEAKAEEIERFRELLGELGDTEAPDPSDISDLTEE